MADKLVQGKASLSVCFRNLISFHTVMYFHIDLYQNLSKSITGKGYNLSYFFCIKLKVGEMTGAKPLPLVKLQNMSLSFTKMLYE